MHLSSTRHAPIGKWTCDLDYIVAGDCTVFSLGSNGDATFEAAILERAQHCKVGCNRRRSFELLWQINRRLRWFSAKHRPLLGLQRHQFFANLLAGPHL